MPNFQTIGAKCSFIRVLIYVTKTSIGNLRELENKGQVELSNPKSGCSRFPKQSFMRAFYYKAKITV